MHPDYMIYIEVFVGPLVSLGLMVFCWRCLCKDYFQGYDDSSATHRSRIIYETEDAVYVIPLPIHEQDEEEEEEEEEEVDEDAFRPPAYTTVDFIHPPPPYSECAWKTGESPVAARGILPREQPPAYTEVNPLQTRPERVWPPAGMPLPPPPPPLPTTGGPAC